MLYVTTRSSNDAYTAYRAMTNATAPDGGSFVPFRLPTFTESEITELANKSFNQTVAEILNIFFSLRLTGLDLDLITGKNLTHITPMNHRIIMVELWHNPAGKLSYVEEALFKKLAEEVSTATVGEWVNLAVKIAIFFGIYGQLLCEELIDAGELIDFSVRNDDFVSPMAIWYCRNMGLPVNMIICTCDESNNLWDFIHRGTISTNAIGARLRSGLERLLYSTLGCDAASAFFNACSQNRAFTVSEEDIPKLNSGFFCSVAGKDRANTVINSLYRTNSHIIDTNVALCYGGLQDYRAKTGASGLTVILAENTPLDSIDEISAATGLDASMIKNHV